MRGPFGIFKFQDESSPVVLFASGAGILHLSGAMLKSLSSQIADQFILSMLRMVTIYLMMSC